MNDLFVFEVSVETTNCLHDTYCVGYDEAHLGSGKYFDCKDGTIYVLAENLGQIHALLGDIVLSVRKLGHGRVAAMEKPCE